MKDTPISPLYRRWKLVEIIETNGHSRLPGGTIITEFRSDGTVVYETDVLLCCAPSKVSMYQTTLKPLEITTIERNNMTCNCIPPTELRIVTLSESQLVLEFQYSQNNPGGKYTNRYEAVK